MKIALIGDIHTNMTILGAAFKDVRTQKIDLFLNNGELYQIRAISG